MKKNLNKNCKLLLMETADFTKMVSDIFRDDQGKSIHSVDEISKNLMNLHNQVMVTLTRDHDEFLHRISFDPNSGENPFKSWAYKLISTWWPTAPAKWNVGIRDIITPFKGGGLRYDVNEINFSPTQWILALFDREHTLFKTKPEFMEFVTKPEMIEIRRIAMRLRDDFGIPEEEIKDVVRGIMNDVADSLTQTGKLDYQNSIKSRFEDAVKIAKSYLIPGELVTPSGEGGVVKTDMDFTKIENAIKDATKATNTNVNSMITSFQKTQDAFVNSQNASSSKIAELESTLGVFKYASVVMLFFALIYAVHKVATNIKKK